ncbi:tetratricopeptide repeat protein [Streptomyces sp. NBC_01789]|uniref:tetratricopeptide repeat protein n=1 Tax=Streptomyces sp. NBC_01789 TaxID=2975941 RepID=UPI00225BABE6|nr:tetratricopeptide repeat protein [Streptomyces sp. NBC_01789]MCX4451572.1 tetratricopeptide repeat protein [Streptomyces sp. NBC_01789]
MERGRVLGVAGRGGPGSGYAVGGGLVLTSAHVAAGAGERVEVFRPGRDGVCGGRVVWCGTPGGRDDAALVLLDDDPAWSWPGVVRWGRMVTDQPGAVCRTWGVPDVAQRPGQPVEAVQAEGRINPGSGFVGNQYVMDLLQHPPQWSREDTSPWGGLSGASVFCDRLLTGVVASDRAHSGHSQLNVIPAYVLHHNPAFRAALTEHGEPATGLEAAEFQHLADTPTGGSGAGAASPAVLLQAGWQAVPFHGRKELLTDLLMWCGRGGFGGWLLHGAGGQGKTRLAHHLAGQLGAEGWAVLWPRSDADASQLRELRDVVKPLLIVLDYAETRTGQLTALIEAAADHPGTTPFKVLLLARTDGDWWTQAKSATRLTEDYLDDVRSVLLAPLEQAAGPRAQAYRTAARALAGALPRVRGLAVHNWASAAEALPTPRLDQDAFANALTLQMTALADLLDTDTADSDAVAVPAAERAQSVEDRLLGHERRYWQHGAQARGLTPALSYGTLETALAAAHLVGAADREHADQTWSRLPALADQPRDRRDQVTAWIAALYPPAVQGRPWGALQPDRLAERHIGRLLDTNPAIAEHLIDGADDAQTAQLLTVYSRAAAHPVFNGSLDAHLTRLCTHLPTGLISHVIATAIQADRPQPFITALNALVTDADAAPEDLNNLHSRFPGSTQRLSRTAAHLAQAVTSRYRTLVKADPDTYLPQLAGSLNNLSIRLGDLGRQEEGLAAVEEAVNIHRVLAEANPDTHLPDLAMSLNNLSIRLGDRGRQEEGLAAVEEAVNIRRVLAEANPNAYLPDLAMCLNNLAVRLGDLGRQEEGLAAVEEAVNIRRVLAKANPDAHLPHLASALNNLSIRLGDRGRQEEGLAAVEEAVNIHRVLAKANPDAHLPDLATSLNNLAVRLGNRGRQEEGLAAVEEAVNIHRVLAKANPDTHLPNLATSLNNLSIQLGDLGRQEEGLAAVEEAVNIHRVLAKANPDTHIPHLAMSLNNFSVDLGAVGRWEEGLAAVEEATRHYRVLAEANPDTHLPHLATSLTTLALDLGAVGRWEESLAAVEEATRHYRVLAEANPDTHLLDLARSLTNLAVPLGALGRWEESLVAVEEAVNIHRVLAEASPDTHLPDLAMSLTNLAVRLGGTGRREEGLVAVDEATHHYRTLAEANRARFGADLQRSLDLAAWLRSLPE